MSFREEDRKKNDCPSRGLGLAAAAIGVGVGAALYYFFSKRPENPDGEGSTSAWQPETLVGCNCALTLESNMDLDSDAYTTISENVTSDTSININDDYNSSSVIQSIDSSGSYDSEHMVTDFSQMDTTSDVSMEETSYSDNSNNNDLSELSVTDDEYIVTSTENNSFEIGHRTHMTHMNTSASSSNSDEEWDITNNTEGIPVHTSTSRFSIRRLVNDLSAIISPRGYGNCTTNEEEQLNILRDQAFRERPWTSEECSICFDVIHRNQEVMTLPCTHNFHQACILPWLQEQQTCPNCRKRAE